MIENTEKTEKTYNVELLSLSSKKDLSDKNFKRYENIISEALNNSDIKNIAVSGKYGSGKSSIIDSYFQNQHKDEFLRVSFASFSENQVTTEDNDGEENDDTNQDQKNKIKISQGNSRKIEQSIINQILYQIDPTRIPLTNFKIKQPLLNKSKVLYVLETLLIITAIIPQRFNIIFSTIDLIGSMLSFIYGNNTYLTSLILQIGMFLKSHILVLILPFLVWNIWSLLNHFQIKNFKLSFKSVGAEINLPNDDLFEKYIDEIIYIFQQSGKSILILEDIDRFNRVDIFEKLRELNIKLNNNVNGENSWKFIYLIKDDIFSDATDRVKFFDLIIPVIPFVTTANAYSKFSAFFAGEKIDSRLFEILGNYIGDYRLLLNTINEYRIFKQDINAGDSNQLLALIGYKNLYPKDFDVIQNGGGSLNELLEKLSNDSRKEIAKLEKDILDIQNQQNIVIASTRDEILLLDMIRNVQQNSSMQSVTNFKTQYTSPYTLELPYDSNTNKSMSYTEYEQTEYFKERVKVATNSEHAQDSIDEKLERIYLLKHKSWQTIDTMDWTNLKNETNELLYTLIISGYVNEHYLSVINKYYGTDNNSIFFKNLLSHNKDYDFNIELTDIDHLVKELNPADYLLEQIQNYFLLHFHIQQGNTEFVKSITDVAQKVKKQFLEKYFSKYPEDFDKFQSIVNKKIAFEIIAVEDESVIEKIVEKNWYKNSEKNIKNIISFWELNNNLDKQTEHILNSDNDIYKELKIELIKKLTILPNVNEVYDKELLDYYIQYSQIAPTVETILDYLNIKKLSDNEYYLFNNYIGNFIDTNIEFLISELKEWDKKLFDSVLFSNQIKFETKQIVFSSYNVSLFGYYDSSIIDNISTDEFNLLLDKKIMHLDQAIMQKIIMQNDHTVLEYFNSNKVISYLYANPGIKGILDLKTLKSLVDSADDKTFTILSRFVDLFGDDYESLIDSLNKFTDTIRDTNKFIRVLKGDVRAYTNKFTDNEQNKNILDYLLKHSFIAQYELEGVKYRISKIK
ncbi:YobI family P-loop NTPase [Leuconostoc citreum]